MHRVSKKLALLACALAVAACSGQSKTNPADSTGQAGDGQTFYSVHVVASQFGVITDSTGQINCGPLLTQAACDGNYLFTATAPTFTATASGSSWVFEKWAADATGAAFNSGTVDATNNKADKTVVATFMPPGGWPPPGTLPDPNAPVLNSKGRLFGLVTIGGLPAAGVKVAAGALSSTTNALGAYVFDVDPGSYTLHFSDTNLPALYVVPADFALTVPAPTACAVKSASGPGADNANGCLVRNDFTVTATSASNPLTMVYDVNSAIAGAYFGTKVAIQDAAGNSTGVAWYNAGFGATVNVACVPGGSATVSWVQTNGPTAISTTTWGTSASFTTPTIQQLADKTDASEPVCVANPADPTEPICTPATGCPKGAGSPTGNPKVGCGVSNFHFENRPRFFPINKQQSGEMTYTFECTATDGTYKLKKTISVVMASVANTNLGDFMQTPATGTPMAAAARTPPGVIVIGDDYRACRSGESPSATLPATAPDCLADGSNAATCQSACRPTFAWTLTGTVSNSLPSPATALPVSTAATLQGATTKNPWFLVPAWSDVLAAATTGTPSASATTATWTLKNDSYGNGSISLTEAKAWSGFADSCNCCHGDATANRCSGTSKKVTPEVVTEWQGSKHNHIVIDGMGGTHYSSTCLPCHTVGFNLGVANGGWDDVAAAQTPAYKLPAFTFEGATADLQFATMPTAVQNMSNIQCQNCHGPAQIAGTATASAHSASSNASVCGSCHDGGTHGIYSQWKTSGHARLDGAQNEGPLHGADQTHCARCHYAQGNTSYRAQLAALGNPDKFDTVSGPVIAVPAGLVKPANTSTRAGNVNVVITLTTPVAVNQTRWYLTYSASDVGPMTNGNKAATVSANGLTVTIQEPAAGSSPAYTTVGSATMQATTFPAPVNITADNVETVGCQTCHNPHSLEMNVPEDQALPLAGGFTIPAGGSGATCAMCHNSRNGMIKGVPTRHIDTVALTSANFGMTAPHSAAQADVYYAGNGYLLGTPAPARSNPHQNPVFFKDTCAECHVKRFSAAAGGTVANHTFGVDKETCVGCHGVGTELISRETKVEDRLTVYKMVLAKVLNKAGITTVNGKLNGATTAADYTVASGVTISSVNVSGDRPLTLDLKFSNGAAVTGIALDKVMSSGTPTLVTVSGSVTTYYKVAKSVYNYALIENDKSFGVHNIPWVDAMLDAMITEANYGTAIPF